MCVCVCVCVCVHARVSSVVVCVEKKQNLLLFVLIWVFWFCFGGRCFIYIYREIYICRGVGWGSRLEAWMKSHKSEVTITFICTPTNQETV